jgi:hypothetical protein
MPKANYLDVTRGSALSNELASPARGATVNTHGLERTCPKGGPFIGRCVYCGAENLSMKAALEPCPAAPDQSQQVLNALEPREEPR